MLWNLFLSASPLAQLTLGGVVALALIVVMWAIWNILAFWERHPTAVNTGVLCALIPLWLLFNGTWMAGVLGLCCFVVLIGAIPRKNLGLTYGR